MAARAVIAAPLGRMGVITALMEPRRVAAAARHLVVGCRATVPGDKLSLAGKSYCVRGWFSLS